LADLVPRLDAALNAGQRCVVLDNTYPTRASRNAVIETAWTHGVRARCVWLATSVADAQINSIHRMIDAHGRLPSPEDIRALSDGDPRYLSPDAPFRYERMLEAPSVDEGFETIDQVAFARDDRASDHTARAIILDADTLIAVDTDIAAARRDQLARFRDEGWLLFAHAWRPEIARGKLTAEDVHRSFAELRHRLGLEIDFAVCAHDAGPPICWCRKPIPGSVIDFARHRGVSLRDSIVVGMAVADRTMAGRIGARFESADAVFGD
jgi:histidinol phosphatase-like enzyme